MIQVKDEMKATKTSVVFFLINYGHVEVRVNNVQMVTIAITFLKRKNLIF